MRKFYKVLFFVNKVHNRILHNNLSTLEQNMIKYIKYDDDDILLLIPTLGYNQLFQTLGFYIENNARNCQIQEAMRYVYFNDYIKDDELKEIKDVDGESIIMKEGNIEILLTKEEINEVKTMFSKIKNFNLFCEKKTWDK